MRRLYCKSLWITVVCCLLAGCLSGSGGSSSSTTENVRLSNSVNTILLSTSSDEIAQANEQVIVTAVLTNSDNQVLSGITVDFAASSGTLTRSSGITDSTGTVTTVLTSPEPESRTITLTASVNSLQTTATVNVTTSPDFALEAASDELQTADGSSVLLTAELLDQDGIPFKGSEITFAANNDGILSSSKVTTDEEGKATTLLTTEKLANREITITATIGGTTEQLTVGVIGTSLKLTSLGNTAQINSNVEMTVTLTRSDGSAIENETVLLSSSSGNGLSSNQVKTNNAGQASVTLTATNSGTDTITATALDGDVITTFSLNVSDEIFTIRQTAPDADGNGTAEDIILSGSGTLTLNWEIDNIPQAGVPITLQTTRGVFSNGIETISLTTDLEGKITTTITSTNAGSAEVFASATAANGAEFSNYTKIYFVANTPGSVTTSAFPSTLAPGEQSTITAIVRDPTGNLVANQRINFSINDIGKGTISPAFATTNELGVAKTTYTAGTITGLNGVLVTARSNVDLGILGQVGITVAKKDLLIALGPSKNLIIDPADSIYYTQEFGVLITDNIANAAAAGVEVNVKVVAINYHKGKWVRVYEELLDVEGEPFLEWRVAAGDADARYLNTDLIPPTTPCISEDVDFNGFMDTGEDFNGDGQLTPGGYAAVTQPPATDSKGETIVKLRYFRSMAPWVTISLIVTAESISGTEHTVSITYRLPYLEADVGLESITPPGGIAGRFGRATDCSDPN